MNHRMYMAAAAALTLMAALPARAQETVEAPPSLVAGKHAFSFDIPQSGGGAIGGWANLTARTQLGVRLGAHFRHQRQTASDSTDYGQTVRDMQLGVEVRRFMPVSAAVAPFVGGSLFTSFGRQTQDDQFHELAQSYWGGGADLGIGVEWFPVSTVSVGGRLSVDATYSHTRARLDGAPGPGTGNFFEIGTGTSALSLKIYF
ncbi:MAG TPA: hypothetical protein VF771_12420 [Longimicrobiaceae bacterium]